MKNRIIALTIPSLLCSASVDAVEIFNQEGDRLEAYGKISVRRNFYRLDTKNLSEDRSSLKLGFRGDTQISEKLMGYGQWEAKGKLTKAEDGRGGNFSTQLGFAGINFDKAGSVDYGRNFGVIYDVAGWTDVRPVFGGDTNNGDTRKKDEYLFTRSDNVATYRNSSFFGLVDGWNFSLQFKPDSGVEERKTIMETKLIKEQGPAWGISTTYDLGSGFTIGGAAFLSGFNITKLYSDGGYLAPPEHKTAQAYTTGIKYNKNNIYLAAMYTKTRNAIRLKSMDLGDSYNPVYAGKTDNVEFVAQYQFDCGIQPSLGYYSSYADVKYAGRGYVKRYATAGATYHLDKKTSFYVDYLFNLLGRDYLELQKEIKDENIINVGFSYKF